MTVATACLGVYALSHCVLNWRKPLWRRVVLGTAALLLIRPGWVSDGVGLGAFVLGAWYEMSTLVLRRTRPGVKARNGAAELDNENNDNTSS